MAGAERAVAGADHDTLCALGIDDLAAAFRRGALTPAQVTAAHLERIDALDPTLNSYLTVLAAEAARTADALGHLLDDGVDLGPLHGVPVSVKDLFAVRGTRTTAASRLRLDAPAEPADATVVTRLRRAGAVLLGKTNLHEFAAGVPDPAGPFGPVHNPRRPGHQPGSSSSGAAAAVAAGLCVAALGTDTAQSVRVPAALCGVVGLKPTRGSVPLTGAIPLSVTLDHAGVIARSVPDAAHVLRAIQDPPPGAAQHGAGSGRPLRIGAVDDEFFLDADEHVLANYRRMLDVATDLGHTVVPVRLPGVADTPALLQQILQVDAAVWHERYRGREDEYGASFRDIMLPGRALPATAYASALVRAGELARAWAQIIGARVDVLMTPACPCEAPPHGVDDVVVGGRPRPFRMYCSQFVRPFSLVGLPAIVLPSGVGATGLPTAVQLVAAAHAEPTLIDVAARIEARAGVRFAVTVAAPATTAASTGTPAPTGTAAPSHRKEQPWHP